LLFDQYSDITDTTTSSDTTTGSAHTDESHKVNTAELNKIPLIPVNCSFGIVTTKEYQVLPLQKMIQRERKLRRSNVTVLFAIRTPSCGGCRENALLLSELYRTEPDVNIVGIVKETGVDDAALLEFYEDYFRFPLYKDDKWKIYHAMGGRRICRWTMFRHHECLIQRVRAKGINLCPSKGDFRTYGGVMVFDRHGELRYTHYEKFGEEFDMDAIRAAIHEARSSK